MRIVVNTRLLLPGKLEGIGNFIQESFTRIVRNHPEHEFIFLMDRKIDTRGLDYPNLTIKRIWPPTRHIFLIYYWFHLALPLVIRRLKPDIFVSTDGFFPLQNPCPSLNIIHDINFAHRPQDLPRLHAWYYNTFFPRYARIASRLATVSEYSKADLVKSYGIDAQKIDVVYNGVNELFHRLEDADKTPFREKYSRGIPYFIYVGSMHARKNLEGVLQAYELYREHGGKLNLVLVGRQMFRNPKQEAVLTGMKYREDVIFTGRLATDELAGVLASASAMVFIPYFEGFGIPLIEAFQAGVPVICSSTTSLPEVAGDAALLAAPDDIGLVARLMREVTEDAGLRDGLIQRGLARAGMFSWDRTADLLWESILRSAQSDFE